MTLQHHQGQLIPQFFKIGPHPDCSGWETSQEGDCVLLPKKWNKDNKGAWRMDLPVDIEDTYDDRCEDEIDKNDYQVDTGDREIESSMGVSSNQGMFWSFFKIKTIRKS